MTGLRIACSCLLLCCIACSAHPQYAPVCSQRFQVPNDVDQAVKILQKWASPQELAEFKASSEQRAISSHSGLRVGMTNCWGLWANSEISRYFISNGIEQPEEMIVIMLTGLWRHINGQPAEISEQIEAHRGHERVAKDPDPFSNPQCKSGIRTIVYWDLDFPLASLQGIHMGKCCLDSRVWAYHADRGWFNPGTNELAAWTESTQRTWNPCETKLN